MNVIQDRNAIKETVDPQHLSLGEHLQQLQSGRQTGRLDVCSPNGTRWSLHLFMGRIIWATGGSHPEQRWFRLAARRLAHLETDAIKRLTPQVLGPRSYQVLIDLYQNRQIPRETAIEIIQEVVEEILFDLLYEEALFALPGSTLPLEYSLDQTDKLDNPMSLLRSTEVYEQAQTRLQQWQRSDLAGYSPNTAPVIQYPLLLQQQTSPQHFKLLSGTINGRHSLRNLCLLMQKDLLELAQFLHPFVASKTIRLDYEQEQSPPRSSTPQTHSRASSSHDKPLIICIDDSPIICQQLEQTLTHSGYQFLGIQDPTQAIPQILRRVPTLIFLDLIMPVTNGYEICAQIRRTRKLQDVPVVILTSNTGIIFQARARMVGCTDYLTKPIQNEAIMQVLERYLVRSN